MADDDDDDYRVGYGRPPRHSQFRKGQSGNPYGRPQKKPSQQLAGCSTFSKLVLDEAKRTIRVKDNGNVVEMTQMQAVIRSTVAKAVAGGPMAQRAAAEMFKQATEDDLVERQSKFDAWKSYVSNWWLVERRAQAQGLLSPHRLPHPDDMIFHHDTLTVEFIGPIDEEDSKCFETLAEWRELMFALYIHGDSLPIIGSGQTAKLSLLHFGSLAYNARQPPRLRWDPQLYDFMEARMVLSGRRCLRSRIKHLCERLDFPARVAFGIASEKPMISPTQVGMQWVGSRWVRDPGWSIAKAKKQIWSDFPFERFSVEQRHQFRECGVPVPRRLL